MRDNQGALTGSREPSPASGLGPAGFDPERVELAIIMAAKAHRGQRDKAGAPYILHPLRLVSRFSTPLFQAVAALHDTVEDTGLMIEEIRYDFGEVVADAVDALTRRKGESYGDFIERCGKNSTALAVKIVDLQDNMDLARLPAVTEADHRRNAKYQKALDRLSAIAIETRRADTGDTESVAKR